MAKYLLPFQTHADYEAYRDSENYLRPNVSYCDNNNDIHYNYNDPRLIAKYNVTSTTYSTMLTRQGNAFDEMEIDGVVQPNIVTAYTFNSTGEHTVKYTLKDTTKISMDAFNYCSTLIGIEIPQSVTQIEGYAFYRCNLTGELNLPKKLMSIGPKAFNSNSNLTGMLKMPQTVEQIGNEAFYQCSGFTGHLDIPPKIKIINSNTFYRCIGFTSVTIPDGVTTISSGAFYGCDNISSINLPNSINYIAGGAFNGCSGLTCDIVIPNGVTILSNSVFNGCYGIQNINIPNSVTTIDSYALNYCTSLSSITIPSSVTTINQRALSYCSALTFITIEATTPPTLSNTDALTDTNNCPIYVPSESVETYKAATNWSSYASRIQAIPTT